MLKDLPFTGTTRVANKGVDVALVVLPEHTEDAVKAARLCGVCGISTAVLEVTQLTPPDQRTLEHFCTTTKKLVFANRELLDAHVVLAGTEVMVVNTCTIKSFSDAVFAIKRK